MRCTRVIVAGVGDIGGQINFTSRVLVPPCCCPHVIETATGRESRASRDALACRGWRRQHAAESEITHVVAPKWLVIAKMWERFYFLRCQR
jgi:hypothetical protein